MPEEVAGERKKRQKWMKELLNNKLGVVCEVGEVRKSNPIIVAKIVGEEGKKEIMKNKYKLKGEKLFIENDLSFEDRKVQEKMSRWARGKRYEGIEVKVGRGRGQNKGQVDCMGGYRKRRENKGREGRDNKGGKGEGAAGNKGGRGGGKGEAEF